MKETERDRKRERERGKRVILPRKAKTSPKSKDQECIKKERNETLVTKKEEVQKISKEK